MGEPPLIPAAASADGPFSETDRRWMQRALNLARHAERCGEVPVGAVLVRDGELVAEAWNRPIASHDPTGHAEIQALRRGGRRLRNYRLPGTTLYVTLEPCPMCAGAIIHARVARLVFAAADPRTGAAGGAFDLLQSPLHNHSVLCQSGLLAEQSTALLQAFFRARRGVTGRSAGG